MGMDVKEFGIENMVILPPRKGVCPECAVEHEPHEPHNPGSLYYQYKFRQKHGRFPTWDDALEHCPKSVHDRWREKLLKHGVIVKPAKPAQ